ncbi:MAG: hypothetical protein ACQETQ_13135 [Spirochaetota bacterium]
MTRFKLLTVMCILIGLAAYVVPAQEPNEDLGREPAQEPSDETDREKREEMEVSSRVDWRSSRFHLDIRMPIPEDARNSPASSFGAEQTVKAELPHILRREAARIQVDSYESLEQQYSSQTDLAVEIAGLADELDPITNRQTPDLRFLRLEYAIDLYPHVISPFIDHSRTRSLPRIVSWRPSREFTGVVIYAKGRLPVHGENRRAQVRPALLPDILFGEQTDVLMEPNRIDPEVLEEQGAVAYATSYDDPIVAERAGSLPFRTSAVGVFGRTATDPIIPREDAESFFAEPGNHQLIREGRIVIILEESQLN